MKWRVQVASKKQIPRIPPQRAKTGLAGGPGSLGMTMAGLWRREMLRFAQHDNDFEIRSEEKKAHRLKSVLPEEERRAGFFEEVKRDSSLHGLRFARANRSPLPSE